MELLARELIQRYVDGWKENNVGKITKPLAKDCIIIESHGSTYRGIEQVKQWVDFWIKDNGKVIRWEITSFYFVKKERVALFEWDFACTAGGKNHALFGISIVRFTKNKITFIHEYRMTKNPYNWDVSELKLGFLVFES